MAWQLNLGKVGFSQKGIYDNTLEYTKNDVVVKDNIVYVCIADSTVVGESPDISTLKWAKWVDGNTASGTPNTLVYFDDSGDPTQLPLDTNGVVSFDSTNKLHLTPLPTASTNDKKRVVHLNSNPLSTYGDAFIDNFGRINVTGAYNSSYPVFNPSSTNKERYYALYCPNIVFVSVYAFHVGLFGIDTNGDLWAIGDNRKGGLGFPTVDKGDGRPFGTRFDNLTKVPNVSNVTDVACQGVASSDYSAFIVEDYITLKSCGSNQYGVCGLGHTNDVINGFETVDVPNQVGKLKLHQGSYNIYAGVFITDGDDTDNLIACGRNAYGALGLGNTTDVKEMTRVPNSGVVTKAYALNAYSSYCRGVILSNGRVGTTGYDNNSQQIGHGASTSFIFTDESNYTDVIANDSYAGMVIAIDTSKNLLKGGYSGYYTNLDNTNTSYSELKLLPHPIQGKVKKVLVNNSYNKQIMVVLTTDNELWKFGNGTSSLGGLNAKNPYLIATKVVDFVLVGSSTSISLGVLGEDSLYYGIGSDALSNVGTGNAGDLFRLTEKVIE